MSTYIVERIEQMLGCKMTTHRDFIHLSDLILERTRERISGTTLRRVWGITPEGVSPRRYTLDVLARFLLFKDYDDFCRNAHNEEIQSGIVSGERIKSSDLHDGQTLRIIWQPDRSCLVRHQGNGRFVILQAQNTKLSRGDTFTCHLFINHEPLYLDDLMHEGQGPFRYIAGKQTGITVEKVASKVFI